MREYNDQTSGDDTEDAEDSGHDRQILRHVVLLLLIVTSMFVVSFLFVVSIFNVFFY